MRKRTIEEIMASKAIYRKHAERYKAAVYPEHRAKRMLAYTAKLTKAIAESAQEARTARSVVSHEELQGQSKEAATDEPHPPKFIRENCMTCDNRIYASEVMEYTGKVMEAPTILADGMKEMEYEYLYKCCRCGSKLWVPEQMAKEGAIDDNPILDGDQEALYEKIQRHNTFYFAKSEALKSVTDVYKYHKRANRLGKLSLLIGELELQYIRAIRQRWEHS